MKESEHIRQILDAILSDLAKIHAELKEHRESVAGREQFADIQQRIQELEKRVGLVGDETAPEAAAPVEEPKVAPPEKIKLPPAAILRTGELKEIDEEFQLPKADIPEVREEELPETEPTEREEEVFLSKEEVIKPPTVPLVSHIDDSKETSIPSIRDTGPAIGKPPSPPKGLDWGEVESWAGIWGARIGAFFLVVALGYLLSIGFGRLGIFGKALIVYVACLAMLAVGVATERKENYSTWAKTMIAGGWAGLYVTTFLIHYLPEARLIQDASQAVFLMMGIAAGMIIHSFKYRSQMLTGIAYFIAFVTIALSINLADERHFSLVAAAVLAVSLLFILHRMQWFKLALFGNVACYFIYIIWLYPLAPDFWAAGTPGTEFWPGLPVLILFWLIFTIAVYISTPIDKKQEALSLAMVAVNYFLFALLFRLHAGSVHPELQWIFFAAVSAGYIFLSYVDHTWRRWNFYTLNLVIAVLSSTMAFYFKLYENHWVSVGWLLQAQALYVAGLLGDDKRFRTIGIVNFCLVGVWVLFSDFAISNRITFLGIELYQRTFIFATTAAVFYINAYLNQRMASRITKKETHPYLFSYAASFLWFLLMMRNWYPSNFLAAAVIGATLGLILLEIGIRIRDVHFRIQGAFFAFLGAFTALIPLLGAGAYYLGEGIAYRITCEILVIALAYIAFARLKAIEYTADGSPLIEVAAAIYSALTAVIVVMLTYREFGAWAPVWIALAWMAVGIALFEIGLALKNVYFRVQGYLITALPLLWIVFFFSFPSGWFDNPMPHALAIVLVIAGFFYLFIRLLTLARGGTGLLSNTERAESWKGSGPLLAAIFSVAATLILILFLRRELVELRSIFVAVAWMAVAVGLLEAGIAINSQPLRLQAIAVTGIAFIYALAHNLGAAGNIGPFSGRIITLVFCIGAIYYIYERFFRGEMMKAKWADLPSATPILSWLAAILLVLLVQMEVWSRWPVWVGVAWLVPMVGFFLMGARRLNPHFFAQGIILGTVIFMWTLLRTIPAVEGAYSGAVLESQRVYATVPILIVFYGVFWVLFQRKDKITGEALKKVAAFVGDIFSWWATLLLIALITVEVNDFSQSMTTIIWIALAIGLYETGRRLANSALKAQGFLIAFGAFSRIILVNLGTAEGSAMLLTGRAAAIALVAAGLYYLWYRLRRSDEDSSMIASERQLGAVMSYLATASLVFLFAAEIKPYPWIPPVWGLLLLAVMAVGLYLRERHFLYQSMILVVPIVLGVVALSFPMSGFFIRWQSSGLAIAALFLARILWQLGAPRGRGDDAGETHISGILSGGTRHIFSFPAASLLFILIPLELYGEQAKYLTVAWACEGFLLMILGFTLRDISLRFAGLGLLAFCVIKVFVDVSMLDIERIYKVVALSGLGAILIIIGLIYAYYRERIMQKFMKE